MNTIRRGAISLVLSFCAFSANAINSGNDLHKALQDERMVVTTLVFIKSSFAGMIMGYELAKTGSFGVMDPASVMQAMGSCIPEGVNNGQLRDVVAKYLENNPARRHLGAGFLFLAALREAFPCPK